MGAARTRPKPAWQTDTGCSARTVSDVSAVADPQTGVWVYDSADTGGVGRVRRNERGRADRRCDLRARRQRARRPITELLPLRDTGRAQRRGVGQQRHLRRPTLSLHRRRGLRRPDRSRNAEHRGRVRGSPDRLDPRRRRRLAVASRPTSRSRRHRPRPMRAGASAKSTVTLTPIERQHRHGEPVDDDEPEPAGSRRRSLRTRYARHGAGDVDARAHRAYRGHVHRDDHGDPGRA